MITAGVYESEIADAVNSAFEEKQGMPYKEALEAVAAELNLSKASVTSYLPYKKGVYFRENCEREQISVVAEDFDECGRGRKQLKRCRAVMMNSISGSVWLLFKDTGSRRCLDCRFPIRSRPGGMGELTKELWIDRRESSKSLTWSSILLAF